MSENDFVSRLRIRWESMGDMANDERATAADEIAFLRMSQQRMMAHIATLRAERDEARREVCSLRRASASCDEGIAVAMREYARIMGWDCFKENTNDR